MYHTTTSGHLMEFAVLASVLAIVGALAYFEKRRKAKQPKPRGATKI